MAVGGCATSIVSPFSAGQVDARSTVAADVAAAAKSPGPYPEFTSVPPIPHDVRPVSAWRSAVRSELADRQRLEAEAAAVPFILSDSEAWAQVERAKIPASETKPVSPDEASESEAYAEAQRARATPPPAPH
jgi:hypothetical protein